MEKESELFDGKKLFMFTKDYSVREVFDEGTCNECAFFSNEENCFHAPTCSVNGKHFVFVEVNKE